jgi:hypothetical protein
MGTSASPAELGRKLSTAATNLGQGQTKKRSVEAAALVAKDVYNDQAAKAGLPPGSTLAGRKWNGYGYKLRGDGAAIVEPRGPVWLHNSPTRAHLIRPRGQFTATGRKRRKAGSDALRFDGQFAGEVDHPGTRGKRWASKAVALIETKAPEAYQKEQSSVWRAVFK